MRFAWIAIGFATLSIGAGIAFAQVASKTTAKTVPEHKWQTDLNKALAEAKKSGSLVMVDFNATWCGPCQMYKKLVFNKQSFQTATKGVVLVEIDIDQQPQLAKKYKVSSIPDLRWLSPDGKQVGAIIGFVGKDKLIAEIAKIRKSTKK